MVEMPDDLPPTERLCIVREWIAVGRTDDAVPVLLALQQADNLPAILELAKLYDPASGHVNPPPAPEFARSGYRKVVDRSADDALVQDARQRLEALAGR